MISQANAIDDTTNSKVSDGSLTQESSRSQNTTLNNSGLSDSLTSSGMVHGSAAEHAPTMNTFYIGRVYHEASEPYLGHQSIHNYTQYQNFRGLRAAFQRKHSRHIATLYALETAKLDTMTVEDKERNDTVYNLNLPENILYIGLKSSVIASTNLQKGWQFYVGSGVFYDTYLKDSGDKDNYGIRYDFGFGHSWYHCQAMLRFSGDLTNSQSNSDAESAEMVMDFGYNF
jgi:hypothetical protein